MTATNLLPKPVYVEEKGRNLYGKVLVKTTDDLNKVLTPEQITGFERHLSSEHFNREGYVIASQQAGENAVIFVYSRTPAGFYYGQNTARKLAQNNDSRVRDLLIIDYPAFAIRGAIEGFYGIPWTWDERRDIIDAIAQASFNTFVFAPPDINRKVNWREPLPDDYQGRLERLINHAHKHHIRFVYEMLPIGIDLASDLDYRRLLNRCKEVVSLGADAIMVAFDDTNDYEGQHVKREKAGHGQALLLNNLLQQIGSDKVFLCLVPVEYYGVNVTPYLKTIGRELDLAVYVGWSGKKIRSPTVTEEDAFRFAEIVKRKPFLGHNFPVVDEMRKKRRLTIGPLQGLEAGLTRALSGIAFNFMELPYTSLVSGYTAGDFSWNPEGYYSQPSLENSTAIHGKNLAKLSEINPESYVNPNGTPYIALTLRKRRFKDLSQNEIAELRRIFDTMVSLDDLMSEGIDPRIYREIRPWLVQGNITGTLGNLILDGKMNDLHWKARGYAALKMVSGYRLGGLVFEDWILREMRFPANLFYHVPQLRLVADFFETVARKKHHRQKIS